MDKKKFDEGCEEKQKIIEDYKQEELKKMNKEQSDQQKEEL